ncbi:hypothetical protein SOVF_042310 [Spinacia oleracea]|nr:hypothetical protein SOVF_042310 [Spinacia oleracea]
MSYHCGEKAAGEEAAAMRWRGAQGAGRCDAKDS